MTTPTPPSTEADELAAYKKLVRTQAFRAASANGWCNEGLTERLRNLDLEPAKDIVVPVEMHYSVRAMVRVCTAESFEEAQRAALANEGDVLTAWTRDNVSRQGSYVEGSVSLVEWDPENPKVGDPDFTQNLREYSTRVCRANSPQGYGCTLPLSPDHAQHAAGDGVKIVDVWPNSRYTPTPTPTTTPTGSPE